MATTDHELEHLVFLGTHGHVIAVDQRDGQVVWTTSLPSTGYQIVSLLLEEGRLICATRGKVFALDPRDGSLLWSNGLKGLGYGMVCMTSLKSSSRSDDTAVLAAAAQAQAAAAGAAAG